MVINSGSKFSDLGMGSVSPVLVRSIFIFATEWTKGRLERLRVWGYYVRFKRSYVTPAQANYPLNGDLRAFIYKAVRHFFPNFKRMRSSAYLRVRMREHDWNCVAGQRCDTSFTRFAAWWTTARPGCACLSVRRKPERRLWECVDFAAYCRRAGSDDRRQWECVCHERCGWQLLLRWDHYVHFRNVCLPACSGWESDWNGGAQ